LSSVLPFFDFSSFELDVFYISHPRIAQSSSKRRPLDILAVTGKAITLGLGREFYYRGLDYFRMELSQIPRSFTSVNDVKIF